MDEILYCLCCHCVGNNGWRPFPATAIAQILGMSVHKVRYHLRKLRAKGLVDSFYEGGITEDGDVFCYRGWTITKDAFSTEEYKKAHEREREICKKCFNIDIGEND